MEEAKDEELIKLRQELSNNAIENSSLSLRLKSQNEQSKPTKVFHVCLYGISSIPVHVFVCLFHPKMFYKVHCICH